MKSGSLLAIGIGAFLASSAAAEDQLQDVLPGRWRLEPASSQALGDASARIVAAYQSSRLDMMIEFKRNGSLTTTIVSPAGPSSTESEWKHIGENGRALNLQIRDTKTKAISFCEIEFRSRDLVKMTVRLKDDPGRDAAFTAPPMIYQRIK